jgi:NAD(P)H-dependent FMN reductase
MKVLAFGASSSKKSINKQFATYAANLIEGSEVEVLDLNDYELPIFSEDREQELGKPQLALDFIQKISETDLVIISYAEHNGGYTAAYKNLLDWCSRVSKEAFGGKPMLLLGTSPGPGGANGTLEFAKKTVHYFKGELKGSFSLPSFYKNFDAETQVITNEELSSELKKVIRDVTDSLLA